MSIESAKAFYYQMTTDELFRKQLQAATKEERQQILLAAGYEFTSADWEAAKAQFQALNSDSGELSDAELQLCSGGILPKWLDPITNPWLDEIITTTK